LDFEKDDGSASPRQAVDIQDIELSPGDHADFSIAPEIQLLYRPESNLVGTWLYLRERVNNAWNDVPDEYYPRRTAVRIIPRSAVHRRVFISYKDPENYALACELKLLLRRLGFEVYIARDDHAPGTHLWRSKIPEAI